MPRYHLLYLILLANMNKFGEMLESKGIPHIYCTDHVIQCTAKQVFDDKNYMNNQNHTMPVYTSNILDPNSNEDDFSLMKKCRKFVEIFTSSTKKMEKTVNVQKSMDMYNGKIPVKVIVEVVTCWWSTYSMLDRLVLNADNTIPEDNAIDEEEWHITIKIVDILKPFKTAKKLEGDSYETISWIMYMIKNIYSKLGDSLHLASDEDDENCNLVILLNRLISDFKDRWIHGDKLDFCGCNQRQVY